MGLRPLRAHGEGTVGATVPPGFDDLSDLAKAILRFAHAAGGSGRFVRTGMRAALSSKSGGGECDPSAAAEIEQLAKWHLLEYEDNSPETRPPIILDYTLTPRGREFGHRFLQLAAGAASLLTPEHEDLVRFLSDGATPSGFLELIGGEDELYIVRSNGREGRFRSSSIDSLNTAGVILHMGLNGYQLTELGRAVAEIVRRAEGARRAVQNAPDASTRIAAIAALTSVREQIQDLERTANPFESIVLDTIAVPGIDLAMNALKSLELGAQTWAAARDLVISGVARLRSAVDVLIGLRENGMLSAAADLVGIVGGAIWVLEKLF